MKKRTGEKVTIKELAILFALLITLGILLLGVYDLYRKATVAFKESKESERVLVHLTERKNELEKEVSLLHTPLGQEAVIRETFGVARPHEEVIIVVPEEGAEEPSPLSWWRKFLGWFGL